MRKVEKIKLNCLECKNDFFRVPSTLTNKSNKGSGKYCSRSCKMKYLWKQSEYIEHMKKVHKPLPENIKKLVNYVKSKQGRDRLSKLHKGNIPWNKGKKMPEISRENHYLWLEDRTLLKGGEDGQEKRSSKYKNWRREVCNRDNWQCKINNKDCKGRLEVHHILSFTYFPRLRYDLNNGITLCHFHHPRVRKEEKRLSPYFQDLITSKE